MDGGDHSEIPRPLSSAPGVYTPPPSHHPLGFMSRCTTCRSLCRCSRPDTICRDGGIVCGHVNVYAHACMRVHAQHADLPSEPTEHQSRAAQLPKVKTTHLPGMPLSSAMYDSSVYCHPPVLPAQRCTAPAGPGAVSARRQGCLHPCTP